MDYTSFTKNELIKQINKLAKELNQIKNDKTSSLEKDKLLQDIHNKEEESELHRQELLKTQTLLEESCDRYADLYDYAPAGYITLTDKGIIKNINLTASHLLYHKREHLLGIPFVNFLENGHSHKFFNSIKLSKKENKSLTEDFQLKLKRDEKIPVELIIIPIYEYDLKEVVFRLSLTDISARKEPRKN